VRCRRLGLERGAAERRRATSRRGGGAPCGSNNYGQEPPGGGSYQVYADCDGRGSQAGRGSGRNLSAATAANGAAATVARGSSSKSIAERLNGQSLHVEKMGVELRMDSTTAVRKFERNATLGNAGSFNNPKIRPEKGLWEPKGYDAADFADSWRRYLPSASDIRHKRNNRHIFDNKNNFVADVADVAAGLATESDGDPFACLKDPD